MTPEEFISKVGFFDSLTDEERAGFVEASELVSFEPGETLIVEGEEQESLYVLISGRVEVLKRVPGEGDRVLAEIEAGEEHPVVGERGLLGGSGASATVRARSRVEAIKLPRETFRRMISEGNLAAYKLSYRIARTLAQRLIRLDEEVVRAINELEDKGETDFEAFRDKLLTDWSI